MTGSVVEVWFDFASTYSHIAAQRIETEAGKSGVRVAWRPFLLGPVFQLQGMTDSPFNINKTKGEYMWRDMERQCELFRIPFKKPSGFPRNSIAAARIATAAENQPWQSAFIRAVFLANFNYDQDISDLGVLQSALEKSGCSDVSAALNSAQDPEVKARLRERTDEAIARGIFGAPSFFVGDELFWGSDRMDQAISFALSHSKQVG